MPWTRRRAAARTTSATGGAVSLFHQREVVVGCAAEQVGGPVRPPADVVRERAGDRAFDSSGILYSPLPRSARLEHLVPPRSAVEHLPPVIAARARWRIRDVPAAIVRRDDN